LKVGMSEIVADLFGRLLPHAAARIGVGSEDLESCLSVRLEQSRAVDGYVHSADNGRTFEIVINVGLMMCGSDRFAILYGN
jgi:hypothetical protein